MTKLRTFTFEPARSHERDRAKEPKLSRLACIVFALCLTAVTASPAQTFEILLDFNRSDGANPGLMSLVQGTDGNFYGTTGNGGTYNRGTIFKITSEGKLTTVHNSCSLPNCIDGEYPNGLVQASKGDFYGTAPFGGVYTLGVIFRITSGGTLTILHSFDGTDGLNPESTLIQATDGDFYGTTSAYYGNLVGTVFKITPQGDFTTLHTFCSLARCRDGKFPVGGLVQATNGDFYGTTVEGGAFGYGTVFRMTSEGALTTLHSFDGTDGSGPYATLVQATDGDFYGITNAAGNQFTGTVFKITPGGKLTTLHTFCSIPGCGDGFDLTGPLVQATDGNLYGTTQEGGADYCCGTVFQITPEGTLTTLHSFDATHGGQPGGGLLQATNGDFYGATSIGGIYSDGTVFDLSVGLGAFVKTQPSSGKVGTKVIILGNNLTDATAVIFNGTTASFNIVSDTDIETSVPQGATTGTVQVTTSGGTLKSNVAFRVTK